jgi:hypothetical protein
MSTGTWKRINRAWLLLFYQNTYPEEAEETIVVSTSEIAD